MTFTVTVTTGTAREVYGGLTACEAYLLDAVGEGAVAFRALGVGGDDRKRLLISATRYIDRERWQGTANAAGSTVLAWPRDGITVDDVAITNAAQLALVEQATFELVAALAADPDVYTALDGSQNIKMVTAKGAGVEFFSPTRVKNGTAPKLPQVVQDLIGKWLAGTGGGAVVIGGESSGTSCDYAFDECDSYKRSGPF